MERLPSLVPRSVRSLAATGVGLASLGLGVAMVGATGFELLLASGAADRAARLGLPTLGLGLALVAVGYAALSRMVGATDGEDGQGGQEADMYLFDT